jgi:hypothetical protein
MVETDPWVDRADDIRRPSSPAPPARPKRPGRIDWGSFTTWSVIAVVVATWAALVFAVALWPVLLGWAGIQVLVWALKGLP